MLCESRVAVVPVWRRTREESVGFIAGRHDDAFGVWGRQFFEWLAEHPNSFGQLAVHDGASPRRFVPRWSAGRVLAAEQWRGDGSRGLLGLVAATHVPVQQRIGCDHRNDQRPDRNSYGGGRHADVRAHRNAEFRWLDYGRYLYVNRRYGSRWYTLRERSNGTAMERNVHTADHGADPRELSQHGW